MIRETNQAGPEAALDAPALVLAFAEYELPTKRLAGALAVPYRRIEQHRFPDGESRVQLPARLPASVLVVCSLDHPNDKLVELMLVASTARTLGASHLTLIAPYLGYMRQDIAFRPGEAVSQRIVGKFLADLFDSVITVDPHLHRTPRLETAVPARSAYAATAANLMGEFLGGLPERPVLMGPDAESLQWVRAAARFSNLEFTVGQKTRTGDREVTVALPGADLVGRRVIVLDDIASSGHTLAAAAEAARTAGAARIDGLVTHALFADGAMEVIAKAGVQAVWSTDSIVHPTNRIALAPLLAEVVASMGDTNTIGVRRT